MFIPQSYVWGGEAQVDWYEAYADISGERELAYVFCMRSMASGGAFHCTFPHASQQASDQTSFVAECPGCGKDAVQKHYVVSLRTLLEREGLKMYCQFCDASWKASADDRCRVAALVSQQKVVARN